MSTSLPLRAPSICTDIIVYPPSLEASSIAQRERDLFMDRSWKVQAADLRLLPYPDGRFILKEFPGTCEEMVEIIRPTVDAKLDQLDYNGFYPYVKAIDQMEEGDSLKDCQLNSDDEPDGSSCVGMTLMLIDELQKRHNISGTMGLKQKEGRGVYEHAALLLQCKDGWILIEPSLPAKERFFIVRYDEPFKGKGFSIIASRPGNHPTLTIKGSEVFYYVISPVVAAGDHEVLKTYISDHQKWVPVTGYLPGQNEPHKVIKVNFQDERVEFEDRSNSNWREQPKDFMPFTEVNNGKLLPKLIIFMGADFHTPPSILNAQILKIASQIKLIQQIYNTSSNQV